MHDLLTWYFAVALLGIAALPVTWQALGNLPDRGWALSKPLAILLIGFLCWWPPVVFHALPYTRGWIILVALAFVAANVALIVRRPALGHEILNFVRQRWRYVLINEALFAGVLWLMGYLRALNPSVTGTEKFMDQAFLSAIIRAQHLPPPDPWLSGYPINYYYFGHFLIATLAKLLGTAPAVAFNCGIALTAALVASAIFGVAANLTAGIINQRHPRPEAASRLAGAIPYALFAVLATLVMGNLRSFGVWWDSLGQSGFASHPTTVGDAWQWLTHPATWAATYWAVYWPPSRAIPQTITEFPDFSFLLADLHAHVLALPYAILAIGVALNIWLAPARPGLQIFGTRWQAGATLGVAGLSIGALYLLNGWDLPTYLALALVALILHQWNTNGRAFTTEFAQGLAWAGGALILVCVIPYLPFYLSFSSPGQGVGVVLGTANHLAVPFSAPATVQAAQPESRTALIDELGANGVMLAIFGSWLVVLSAQRLTGLLQARQHSHWKVALPRLQTIIPGTTSTQLAALTSTDSGTLVAHHTVSTSSALEAGQSWLRAWGIVALTTVALGWLTWVTAAWEGWTFIWSLLMAGAALWLALAPLYRAGELTPQRRAMTFPLVLVAFGAGLIAMCEIVFLRDVFIGNFPRMNTVFKAYFQVWTIFALASAPALAWLVGHLRDHLPVRQAATWQPAAYLWRGIWAVAILALIASTLIYPLGTSHVLYPLDQKHPVLSLDGLRDLPPADIGAINWLNAHVQGSPVIVESNDPAHPDYSAQSPRISVFTGLPTLMGWIGHEEQWRVIWLNNPAYAADYSARLGDLHTIYTSSDHALVLQILRRYQVRYVIVGALEWQTYGANNTLGTFPQFLRPVYQADGVVIYGVPTA